VVTVARREHDLIGDVDVPSDLYWGAHTARVVENFPISGETLGAKPYFVEALATVKQAAAEAKRSVGALPGHLADAIVAACIEIRGGRPRARPCSQTGASPASSPTPSGWPVSSPTRSEWSRR
jgi:aspartate ammonia-lyase